jgi:hypothetical protein
MRRWTFGSGVKQIMGDNEKAMPRCFDYPKSLVYTFGSILTLTIFWPIIGAAYIAAIKSTEGYWFYFEIFAFPHKLGWVWLILLLGGFGILSTHRTICVSSTGVDALLLGYKIRSLSWETMFAEKKVTLEEMRGGIVETISLRDGRKRITIKSFIGNYADLKHVLNEKFARHNIEVTIVDRSGKRRQVQTKRPGRI